MKYLISGAALALAASGATAQDLVVQLKGPTLAASAGYLLAEARGYYAAEGLAVALRPPVDAPPFESLARGAADLAVEWLPTALVARENGLPAVNVAQVFAQPALRLTCNAKAGIHGAADLRGKSIGSDFAGAHLPLSAWLNRLGLKADESPTGVTLLRQWPGTEMLRQKQAHCISTASYDQPLLPGTVTLDPAQQGAGVLEDGLYALAPALAAPDMQAQLARFLRASMKGWHEAMTDPEASARLLLGPDPDPGALAHQTRMLRGMAAVLSPDGRLNEAEYRRSIDNLLAGDGAAVLKRAPQGAFTHAISDIAAQTQASATP